MFGRRRRNDSEALRVFRAELAADVHARAALTEAIGRIESAMSADLQRAEREQSATESVVEHLWYKVIDQEHDLTGALHDVARMCALLGERIQAEREERRALTEAISMLAGRSLPPASRPRLVGGSVFATPAPSNGDEIVTIDTESDHSTRPTTGTEPGTDADSEVWCRYENRWVGGFEITEVVKDADAVRCRLRRLNDGYLLPTLFDVDDIRPADPAVTHDNPATGWSRS